MNKYVKKQVRQICSWYKIDPEQSAYLEMIINNTYADGQIKGLLKAKKIASVIWEK